MGRKAPGRKLGRNPKSRDSIRHLGWNRRSLEHCTRERYPRHPHPGSANSLYAGDIHLVGSSRISGGTLSQLSPCGVLTAVTSAAICMLLAVAAGFVIQFFAARPEPAYISTWPSSREADGPTHAPLAWPTPSILNSLIFSSRQESRLSSAELLLSLANRTLPKKPQPHLCIAPGRRDVRPEDEFVCPRVEVTCGFRFIA